MIVQDARLALVLSLLSAMLLALAYLVTPLGSLAWIALAPLLVALDGRPRRSAYPLAYTFAVAWLMATCGHITSWVGIPVLIVPLALAMATVYAIVLAESGRLAHYLGAAGALALPLAWTALDLLLARLPLGRSFRLSFLAPQLVHTQMAWTGLLQIATVAGVYGVTWLILLVNSALARLFTARRPFTPALTFVASLLLVGLTGLWGSAQIAPGDLPTVRVATIQPNAHGVIAYRATEVDALEVIRTQRTLSERALGYNPDVFVWSELKFGNLDDPGVQQAMAETVRGLGAYLAADFYTIVNPERSRFLPSNTHNVVALFSPQGQVLARHLKRRIPIGELSGGGPLRAPEQIVATAHGRLGIAICYENWFAGDMHRLRLSGAQVALLPLDDGRRPNDTGALVRYHAQIDVLRAIENRMATAVAGVWGGSQIVDPFGRVLAASPFQQQDVQVADLPYADQLTFYTRFGDVFGAADVGVLALLASLSIICTQRRRLATHGS
jgi:apolipoprotein N-acyltransferase